MNNTYPQGRKVTQWQINDNLTWTRGQHTLKFGINTRRVDISDYDLGEGTVPTVTYNDLAQFTYGAAYTASQNFPVSLKERVAVGNLEYYANGHLQAVAEGDHHLRHARDLEHQRHQPAGLFSRMAGSFLDASHETNQPLNQVVLGNVHNLFPATPLFVYQPRASFAYQLRRRLRFMPDSASSTTSSRSRLPTSGLMNAPNDPTFTGGIGGQVGGIGIAPGVPGSAVDAAANANKSFQTIFQLRRRALCGHPAGRSDLSAGRQPEHLPNAERSRLRTTTSTTSASSSRSARAATCAPTSWARADCMSPTRCSSTAIRTSAMDALRHFHTSSRSISDSEMSPSSGPARTAATPDCRLPIRSNGAA